MSAQQTKPPEVADLQEVYGPWLEDAHAKWEATCPPCNHDCNQGRDCPARR